MSSGFNLSASFPKSLISHRFYPGANDCAPRPIKLNLKTMSKVRAVLPTLLYRYDRWRAANQAEEPARPSFR